MKETASKYSLKLIESFLNPLIEKAKDFDYKNYTLYEKELNSEIEKQVGKLEKLKRNAFIKGFKFLLNQVDLYEVLEEAKRFNENRKKVLIKKVSRNKLLFELFEEADAKIPYTSIVVLSRLDLQSLLRKQCESIDLFQQYETASGEHRARIAARIYREVSEMLYTNYIRMLGTLNHVINGDKVIKSDDSFGKILSDLKKDFNGDRMELIEEDSSRLRNAIVHASYFYNLDNDSIIYRDKNSNKKYEIPVDSLYEKALRMYEISTLNIIELFVFQINNFVLVDSGLAVFFIENKEKILEQDTETIKQMETNLKQKFAKTVQLKFK